MTKAAGKPRVGLFVTCLVDAIRPRIGFATIRLLEEAGIAFTFPEDDHGSKLVLGDRPHPGRPTADLGEYLGQGLLGTGMRGIFETDDLTAPIVIAHHTGEPDHRAGGLMSDELLVLDQGDRLVTQRTAQDHRHRG